MFDGKNAKRKFEESVQMHKRAFEHRKSLVLSEVPELEALTAKRQKLWTDSIKSGWDVEVVSAKSEALLRDIRDLLQQHGFDESDIFYHPQCPICNDTGYVDGKQCNCLRQKIIEESYLCSNLKAVLQDENFDRFDAAVFDAEAGREQRSPRENVLLIRDHCRAYVSSFDRSDENLLFVGAVGTGKTFMSHCVAKALLDGGKTVVYFTSYDLVDRFADFSFGNAGSGEKKLILNSDLLIIDDLGCERQTEFAQSALFNVMNERLVRRKKMLISTNLSAKEIKEMYNSRIFSRLIGNFTGYKFIGNDLRIR